jgi:hypothetical protein
MHADSVIVGGSVLLGQADANQLATWLGEGDLTLTRIFSKTDTNSYFDFHAAADGQGRTFSVLRALPFSNHQSIAGEMRIGGYNPQSWNSSATYNLTPCGGSAFICNLETTTIQRQNAVGEGEAGSHQYQTYNGLGPTFGGGHDVWTFWNSGGPGQGYLLNYSYGGSSYDTTISGQSSAGAARYFFLIGDLEVFTISNSAAAVPEPGYFGVLAAGMLGLFVVVRRRNSR